MNTSKKRRLRARIGFATLFLGLGVVLSMAAFALWLATYPDTTDPKNVYYVLWKHGLNNHMDLGLALATMSHDQPLKQIQALTRDQLKARFGYILTLDQATPYLQGCYSTPGAAAKDETHGNQQDVVFLRNSPLMIVMKDGKAVDLIFCKGY